MICFFIRVVFVVTRLCLYCQCRLEANYAHQQELDMIPLMMQKDYRPQGWRKSKFNVLRLVLRTIMALTCNHATASGPHHGDEAVVCDVGRGEGR